MVHLSGAARHHFARDVFSRAAAIFQANGPGRGLSDAPEADSGKEVVGPLPGIPNMGNSCYMASVLQCLLNTPGGLLESCQGFTEGGAEEEQALETMSQKNCFELGKSFAALTLEYNRSENGALRLRGGALQNLKRAVGKLDPRFAACEQQDAYEFLGCLLDGLDEGFGALLRSHGCSASEGVVRRVCGIGTYSTRWCQRCLEVREVGHATEMALGLPLVSCAAQFDAEVREREEAEPIALRDLIGVSQMPEEIEGYDCDRCRAIAEKSETEHTGSTMSQRAGLLSSSSDVLVVSLYRFLNSMDDRGNFRPVKVKRAVAIPTVLSLETGEYRLYGVVSHIGSNLASGHYVAAVRSRRDHQWYECNDATVTPLHLRNLYEVSEITATRPGADPFILFYQRFSADMEMAD